MWKTSIQAEITWPLITGLGHVSCDGRQSCNGINFPVPTANMPYYLECTDDSECENSEIYCPSNANCTIRCIGQESCRYVCLYCKIMVINPADPFIVIYRQIYTLLVQIFMFIAVLKVTHANIPNCTLQIHQMPLCLVPMDVHLHPLRHCQQYLQLRFQLQIQ